MLCFPQMLHQISSKFNVEKCMYPLMKMCNVQLLLIVLYSYCLIGDGLSRHFSSFLNGNRWDFQLKTKICLPTLLYYTILLKYAGHFGSKDNVSAFSTWICKKNSFHTFSRYRVIDTFKKCLSKSLIFCCNYFLEQLQSLDFYNNFYHSSRF